MTVLGLFILPFLFLITGPKVLVAEDMSDKFSGDQVLFRIEKKIYMASDIPVLVNGLLVLKKCESKNLKIFESSKLTEENLESLKKLTQKTYENAPALVYKLMILSKLKYHYDTNGQMAGAEITPSCLKKIIKQDDALRISLRSLMGLEALLRERERQIEQQGERNTYTDSILKRYEHELFIPMEISKKH